MLSPHNHSSQLIFAHSTDDFSFIICSWVAPCHGMKRADHPWFALISFQSMSSFLCWWAWTHSSMDGHSSPGGIMEPMRGWLIGYGSLISAFGTFPMVSHWKSYGLPLENHSFWLKNSTWNLMICHWKSFKYTAHVSIQLHFIIPPMLMMLNVYHNVSLGSQKLINPTPCPCFSMAT